MSTSDDENTVSRINLDQLRAHQAQLRPVLDRVDTAYDAATSMAPQPEAFGALGLASGLGLKCTQSLLQSTELISLASSTMRDHIAKVRRWHDDQDLREEQATTMFREMIDYER